LPGNSSEQEMFPQDQIREEWVHGWHFLGYGNHQFWP
jgi:hypothetical protein